MAERNAGVPVDKRIAFRVGLHQGDIVVEATSSATGAIWPPT